MGIENIEDIVELFNNGELDVEGYFGSFDNFFNFLKKRNATDSIDPTAPESDSWQNNFLIWQHENNYPVFLKNVTKILSDIVIENGQPYLTGDDLCEFSELFCDNRNTISQEAICNILRGDYDRNFDYHYDSDNLYNDVIEVLSEKNLQTLYDYIVKSLEGIQVSPETDLLETIAEEQGHPDYVIVNSQTVIRIVDDEETMKSLLDDELNDLSTELNSIYSNAYNSAYESEVYNGIRSELGKYFKMNDMTFGNKPHPYKKNTTIETFKVPIHNFDDLILDFLVNNKSYGHSGTLENYGNFIQIIKEEQECLRYYSPDYPNYSEVDENINLYFNDYL